mmetsp:Transcript_3531/g.10288  ORF Transcript_3531/g.10288 Transcript_3531/m.10288 type:complete len:272 (-) Transcript_3531:3751-4566(-)
MALHFTRERPVYSSTLGASRTSQTSPYASFLSVLLSFTSKCDVIAMSFTHLRYSWNISSRLSLEMPAAYLDRPRSSWLAFSLESGIFSTKLRISASGTSAAPWLSFLKSTSALHFSCRTCARRAAMIAAWASPSTCFLAAFRAVICFWPLDSKEPSRTFSFTSMLRASEKGPLALVLISSRWALIMAWPLSTDSSVTCSSFSALSISASGLSRSAPLVFTRASAAGMLLSTCSCSLLAASLASSMIVLAARLSMASWRRFFSPSMLSTCFF